jgi:hypothetical protein
MFESTWVAPGMLGVFASVRKEEVQGRDPISAPDAAEARTAMQPGAMVESEAGDGSPAEQVREGEETQSNAQMKSLRRCIASIASIAIGQVEGSRSGCARRWSCPVRKGRGNSEPRASQKVPKQYGVKPGQSFPRRRKARRCG